MKKGHKILNSGSRKSFDQMKWRPSMNADYDEFKKVIKAINEYRCQDIVDSDEGHQLPNNLGRLIVLGSEPRVKKLYSMTRPGKQIFNLHTFGIVYRCYHKERLLMRYPMLFNWRSHRQNIKMPLNKHLNNETRVYYKHTDFYTK